MRVVFAPLVAFKGIANACKRKTLQLGLKNKKSLFIPTWCLPSLVWWLPPRRRRAWWGCRRIPFQSSFRVDSLRSFTVPGEWLTWSLSNLLTGMESFARLLGKSLFDFGGFGVVFTLVHRAVWTWTVEHKHPNIFTSEALCRCSDFGGIFGRNRIVACAVIFVPSDLDL